ncbi:DUF1353 domain-containing protein [Agromyces endophyticus]|uniref:DUF1353 domain-containing protein n=1 Tax=Agromyces sp. H17E-10 TaxID=2932244 RepID=UPI001FD57CD0|nr:DUF1353 domain-containing protein [Agromyces sp. H17E-10]UOQ88115.1 DUF1353 domain-containing protein [Agromyces sp. H17E-10]
MPFLTDDGEPLAELGLAQRPSAAPRFELTAAFTYLDPETGRRYRVPARHEASLRQAQDDAGPLADFSTDLASVPTPLWGMIASYGRQSAPAVLHDARSREAAALGDDRAALVQRREDDRVFHTGLRELGVPRLRARLMQTWVAADRERQFGGVRGWALVVQAVVGAVALVAASVAAWWNPWWLVAWPIVALAVFVHGRLAGLVATLTFSLALLGPFVLVQLAALVPFRLVEALVELVTRGDPGGVWRPTLQPGSEDQGQP